MKANLVLALVSIGALCVLGPMPAQARGGGGSGHSANSGAHASQNQPSAAKAQTAKKKGNKETYLKYELKDATVSSARAKKSTTGKASLHPITINKKIDKSSPQ